MEAISHAGAALGILAKDGVVLAAEKPVTGKLLEVSEESEKMYRIDDHMACVVAGITSDANILINNARLSAQRYTYTYGWEELFLEYEKSFIENEEKENKK